MIMDTIELKAPCVICGVVQSDFWWLDFGKNICRCNPCLRQGLSRLEDRLKIIRDGETCYMLAPNFTQTGEVHEITCPEELDSII